MCGWQLHDRVVLQEWDEPAGTHRSLRAAGIEIPYPQLDVKVRPP